MSELINFMALNCRNQGENRVKFETRAIIFVSTSAFLAAWRQVTSHPANCGEVDVDVALDEDVLWASSKSLRGNLMLALRNIINGCFEV